MNGRCQCSSPYARCTVHNPVRDEPLSAPDQLAAIQKAAAIMDRTAPGWRALVKAGALERVLSEMYPGGEPRSVRFNRACWEATAGRNDPNRVQ